MKVTTILALMLAGCATTPAVLNPPSDLREARLSDFNFVTPREEQLACWNADQKPNSSSKPADCEQLGDVEYFRGKWLVDRETSYFSFLGEKTCWEDRGDAFKCVELDINLEQRSRIPNWEECTSEYQLEFTGRRRARPVGYPPSYVIVVDRVLSAKRLGFAKPKDNICGRMG